MLAYQVTHYFTSSRTVQRLLSPSSENSALEERSKTVLFLRTAFVSFADKCVDTYCASMTATSAAAVVAVAAAAAAAAAVAAVGVVRWTETAAAMRDLAANAVAWLAGLGMVASRCTVRVALQSAYGRKICPFMRYPPFSTSIINMYNRLCNVFPPYHPRPLNTIFISKK